MLKGIQLTLMAGPGIPVRVPRVIIDALQEATVTVTTERNSYFQLKFRISQRSPLQTLFVLPGGGGFPKIFRVLLIATINGQTETLINGVMTNHQISSGSNGEAILTITGEDLTRALDYLDFTGLPYPGMPVEARVLAILARYSALGIAPKIIPAVVRDVSSPLDYVPHHKGTDLDYLRLLASDVGYKFYLEPGGALSTTAYFGPDIKVGKAQPALSFNMGVHTNVESLSFQIAHDKPVLPIVTIHERRTKLPIPIPVPNVNPLSPPLGLVPMIPKTIEKIDSGAHLSPTKALLKGLARASQSADAVTATGSLDVLQYGRPLKARRLVGVRGAGVAFNGLYYVQSVTHRLSVGQYKQDFTLTRNGLVSIFPKVSV